MTSSQYKQLNPFELKIAISELLSKINSVEDIQNCILDFEMLDAQENKSVISKILFKELVNSTQNKIPVICFLLEHYVPKQELIAKFWETLKNQNLQNEVKITILNILRDLDADWSYETCEEYLDDAQSLLDENTKNLLNSAVINPEVQIDFLDFMATIRVQDKITLINSLADDFTSDALANILIPVFVSEPNSSTGKEALNLLGQTKSQLALHVLDEVKEFATGELLQAIKKNLSTLKIAGMREDNTKEFYKQILSNSKPYHFYATYPDGHGDIAMIFTRITENEKIRFVSIVTNIDSGIKDCFGFFEISKFEYSKILERFLRDEKTVELNPESFKTLLYNAELQTIQQNSNDWKFPYEYVCWKNLLIDIDFDTQKISEILKEQVVPQNVNSTIIEKLDQMKVSKHWFLDYQYSNEFDNLLKELKNTTDLETLVKKHQPKIFDEWEKTSWTNKLLTSAYLKFAIGKDDEASAIYGLANSETLKDALYENILKVSIYEYLMVIKYDKKINSYNLTYEEINDKINYIENKWVNNV